MPQPTSKNRNAEVDFHRQRRSNATHASVTDPEARLYKKSPGAGAILCFMGHTLMENRNGLVVQAQVTQADGHAERKAALEMVNRHAPGLSRRRTLGADKAYDSANFVADLRQACVTPHVAQKSRHSAIDGRTTRHPGYAVSQKRRKKIEEPFGWAKTVGTMAQTMLRGVDRLGAQFTLTMAACNLARLPKEPMSVTVPSLAASATRRRRTSRKASSLAAFKAKWSRRPRPNIGNSPRGSIPGTWNGCKTVCGPTSMKAWRRPSSSRSTVTRAPNAAIEADQAVGGDEGQVVEIVEQLHARLGLGWNMSTSHDARLAKHLDEVRDAARPLAPAKYGTLLGLPPPEFYEQLTVEGASGAVAANAYAHYVEISALTAILGLIGLTVSTFYSGIFLKLRR